MSNESFILRMVGLVRRAGVASAAVGLIVLLACNVPPRTEAPSVRDQLAQADDGVAQPGAGAAAPGEERPAAEQAKPARSNDPIAIVNDVPLDRRTFVQSLTESRGLLLLQQIVLREIARQEAERRGLTAAQADIDREYDLTLQADRFDGREPEKLTPARREQLIEEWTRTRGVTRQELAVAMERQTYLRKLAAASPIEISDEMLQKEHARVHGEKAEVRHLQVPSLRAAEQVKARLTGGERFEDLVADYSQNSLSRERRGLLPPFSKDDPTVPAEFARVAFALEPGQMSNPIEVEGSYHILKLERRIPAEDVPFEEAKEKLRHNLEARLLAARMEQLGQELLNRTRLQIEDRVLRDQYTTRRAAGEIAGPPLVR
jgi:parvulin-like peptidyl-prolyl isomerase